MQKILDQILLFLARHAIQRAILRLSEDDDDGRFNSDNGWELLGELGVEPTHQAEYDRYKAMHRAVQEEDRIREISREEMREAGIHWD